jgi:hypothetical protein
MNKIIKKTFVIGECGVDPTPPELLCPVKANIIEACDSDNTIILTSGETQFNKTITPINNDIDLGLNNKRFRNINSISGNTSYWESTIKITTPVLDLGLDLSGDIRKITAENSIIVDDILFGGNY